MQRLKEVDLRSTSATEIPSCFMGSFDRLTPGESMILVTRDSPRPLLVDLQRQRPNLFDWNPLQDHVDERRVLVSRRAQGRHRNVGELLEADHRRLDGSLTEVTTLARQHLFRSARQRFAEFRYGLERHLVMEEQLVFPVLRRLVGTPDPCPRLLGEHGVIRHLLDELEWTLRREDSATVVGQASDLCEVLRIHCGREAREVYPSVDLIDARAAAELVQRMQAL
jgi:uncharacterized protein (DUF2249 family)/hemerythrin-like domain-containing protein